MASSRGPSPSTFRSAVRRRAARFHLAAFAAQLQAASSLSRMVRRSASIVFAPQRKHPEIRQVRVFKSSAVEKGKKERGAADDSSGKLVKVGLRVMNAQDHPATSAILLAMRSRPT